MMGIKESTVSPSFSKTSNSCSAAVLKCQAVNNQCCSPFWTQRLHSFGRQSGPTCSGDDSARWEQTLHCGGWCWYANPVIGRDGHFANYFNTKNGRLSLAMTLYYIASNFCDLGWFQIKSYKKAVLPQGNRAMPQVFFSVEVRQQHSLQV